MASPNQTSQPTQPLSPPTTDPTSNNANTTTTNMNNNNNTSSQTPSANQTTTAPTSASAPQPTQIPATSLKDSGKTRRPRDVRLIHMLLASLGVTAYQERVPLQLLDFAYRYTSNVLTDAVHLATEGYAAAAGESGTSGGRGGGSGGGGGGGAHDVNTVSLSAMRLSIASRLHYQFQTGLPKEFLMDVATERNRVALPGASRGFDNAGNANRAPQAHQGLVMGGMRLPPERFCLTGVGWDMKEEWESEGEEEIQEPVDGEGEGEGDDEGNGDDDDDEDGKMEDIFGEDTAMGEGEGDEDGDKAMADV